MVSKPGWNEITEMVFTVPSKLEHYINSAVYPYGNTQQMSYPFK